MLGVQQQIVQRIDISNTIVMEKSQYIIQMVQKPYLLMTHPQF